MKAWLITWEWANDAAAVSDPIAGVLSPHLGDDRVGWFIEQLYALHTSTVGELVSFAGDPSSNPYRAKVEPGGIYCGHNPMLNATKVQDLRVTRDSETGIETVVWTEKKADGATTRGSVTRRVTGHLTADPVWGRDTGSFRPGWAGYDGIHRE